MPVDTSIYGQIQPPQNSAMNALQAAGQFANFQATANQNKLFPTQMQAAQTELQRQQVALAQDKIIQAHGQYDTLTNVLGSLAQQPNVSHDALVQAGQQLVKNGIISPDTFASEVASMPTDPAKLPMYLRTLNTRALDAQGRLTATYGAPTSINNGAATIPGNQGPFTGFHQTSPAIPNQLTPGYLADPAQLGTTPAGAPIMGTNAQRLQAIGQANANGQVGITPVPAPGFNEAASVTGHASGQQFADDLKNSAGLKQGTFSLQQAIPALERLGTTGTGPTSTTVNQVRSAALTLGIPLPASSGDATKDFDEANKYLTDFVNRNGNSGTNDKLAAAFAGSPSVHISNAAAVDVAKSAVALARLKAAAPLAFQQTGLPPDQYSKWLSTWSQSQDPRAFGIDLMNPAARAKLVSGLTGKEKTDFANSLRAAIGAGIVAPPSAPSNAPAPVQAAPLTASVPTATDLAP